MGRHVRRTPLAGPQAKKTGTSAGLPAQRRRFNVQTFVPFFLVGASLYAYHNSFNGVFVLDDFPSIVDNPRIRRLWPPWDLIVQAHVRPLWQLSLAGNYAIGKFSVWGYHAFNVAVHILAGLVLFGIVRRTLESEPLRARYGRPAYWLATAVAAIWMVHPLQTGSVTYVCQRAESLMGLFFLLTLYCGIRGYESSHRQKWHVAAITASALGMATKEVMVVAPILVLLYDRVFLFKSFKEAVRQRSLLYVGLAVTWAVLGVELARLSLGPSVENGGDIERVTPWEYLRTQPGVIAHYLRLSLWPHTLVLDYQWPVARTTVSVVPWAAVILALLAGTVLAFRRRPWLSFLGAWFFLILGPTSSILPLADLAFEHRMYLPLAAVVTLVVIAGYEVLGSLSSRLAAPDAVRPWLAGGLVVTAVILLVFVTVQRNDDYRSAFMIWNDTVAKRPSNPRAHNNLGNVLLSEGKLGDAIARYSEALRLRPGYSLAHNNLGNALAGQGKLEDAIAHYSEALRLSPNLVAAHNNLGLALAGQGKVEDAIAHYSEALRLSPNFVAAHNNLGLALAGQGKVEDAIAQYSEALRLSPQLVEAHYNLGNALANQGKLEKAIAQFSAALRVDPDYARAHRNLAVALVRQGRLKEGIAHFSEALRIAPSAEAHYNLGTALALDGNTQEAMRHLKETLRLDPAHQSAPRRIQELASSGKQ